MSREKFIRGNVIAPFLFVPKLTYCVCVGCDVKRCSLTWTICTVFGCHCHSPVFMTQGQI